MIIEEQRHIHEDLERLEQAIADRVQEDPKTQRDRLNRDHQIADFLDNIDQQSARLLSIYKDEDKSRSKELQDTFTGDAFEHFYKELGEIKGFHRQYPNEPVENLEKAYKRRQPGDNDFQGSPVDAMFTGEEAYGKFFDLNPQHEQYMNLPLVKDGKKPKYLQYLDSFDVFTPPQCPIKRPGKMTEQYFTYVNSLAEYLEGFMRKTKPLENLVKILTQFDKEFEELWEKGEVPGWEKDALAAGPAEEGASTGVYCTDCEKDFKSEGSYNAHLSGKKHKRAAEARKERQGDAPPANGTSNGTKATTARLKEKAIAYREYRVRKLAASMQTIRSDTRVNVERKQGMTERERQQELDALYAESQELAYSGARDDGEGSDSEGEDKIYNPLKLPLAWDGKPIPFWLYKLHGLGVEFPCEICGNFVYMGRRAYDKHFNEARHIYGLKCLGVTRDLGLFREIEKIEDAQKLWNQLEKSRKEEKGATENVVEMEDAEGHVMPEKVYYDLQKQGLL